MFSYWEQESFLQYDHIIAGAGIVGLHTAVELKERYPDQRVLVLERSLFPYGASTRNAGFACMGSFTELAADLATTAPADLATLFVRRRKGLTLLRKRLGDDRIGYRENGSHELIRQQELPLLEKMDMLNKLLYPILQQDAYRPAGHKLPAFGFDPEQVHALVENTAEGELHTGKMMRALTDLATGKGVEIKTGCLVHSFEEEGKGVTVIAGDPVRAEALRLHGRNLFICTNAFTKELLPDADLQPGRGQVLITDPVPDLPFRGIFHFDEGYYYFREIDGRVLLGGGRNLDFSGETTTRIMLNHAIQADLEEKLRTLILPGRDFRIAQRWSGIMAFGKTKSPVIAPFGDHVYGAFRMGGMGVALGAVAAQELVALLPD